MAPVFTAVDEDVEFPGVRVEITIKYHTTFFHRFPKNLAYKLHQRRGQCQTKLGRFKDAQMSFCEAVAALEFVPKLSPKKKDSLVRDINALSKESESAMNCQISTGTECW